MTFVSMVSRNACGVIGSHAAASSPALPRQPGGFGQVVGGRRIVGDARRQRPGDVHRDDVRASALSRTAWRPALPARRPGHQRHCARHGLCPPIVLIGQRSVRASRRSPPRPSGNARRPAAAPGTSGISFFIACMDHMSSLWGMSCVEKTVSPSICTVPRRLEHHRHVLARALAARSATAPRTTRAGIRSPSPSNR